ncbi:MAG: carbohydrate-binding domain-containing protein [Janthinobacterium lividum]
MQVQAGTYVNDFVTVNTKITIQGVGGMVSMVATVPPPNGKAIITTNTDVTLDHLELSGAAVSDGNGAGVRYQGGNLVMTNCYVHDNQDGILSGTVPGGTVTIRNSEFSHNGTGDGSTHNIYIGDIASLTIDSSYIHDAVVGHEIKSRAENTTITNSRIQDGATGTASYSIDLPNGGNATIQGNVIQQGPASQNPAIIAFGEEGSVYANSALNVTGNTILNDLTSPSASAVWNAAGAPASVTGNSIYGLPANQVVSGAATVSSNTALATEPTLVTTSPWASAATSTVAATPAVSSGTASTSTPALATPASSSVTSAPITATTLALNLSEDAYQGDAQFIVKVDGQALNQAQPVVALQALGQTQTITFNGNFTAGVHDLTISFVNDAWGGTAATDRNLYINSVSENGTQLAGSTATLFSNGDFHIPFTVSTST